jgi:iron complex transport system ATP-binding protein
MGDSEKQEILRSILMGEREIILAIESLGIGFGKGKRKKVLLPPLSASACKGELIAVIGRNGIGKSTLLRTIAGIQDPLAGIIRFSGKEVTRYSGPELAEKIAYVSTEPVKVSNMTVYDLVSLGRYPYTNLFGSARDEDKEAVSGALQKVSLSDFAGRYVAELSDGERQKTMIARILAQNTGIMLMDEPTAFLDVGSKFEILHLLYRLSRDEGKTILFTTHDLNMAIRHSDRIWLILGNGMVEGSPEDLMLDGLFDHLFESSSVRFDSADGTYSFRDEIRGSVYISGGGRRRHWTEEAVRRAGFSVSKEMTPVYITIDEESWMIISPGDKKQCASLFEVADYLENSPAIIS